MSRLYSAIVKKRKERKRKKKEKKEKGGITKTQYHTIPKPDFHQKKLKNFMGLRNC